MVQPGLLATIQDLGRPGAASLGIAPSGALDRGALRTANRLVGNPEQAAGIEVTMGGFRAVAGADTWFAVAGAWGPILLDGHEVDPYEAHRWPRGAELHLDWFAHGARGYLAVRGGLDGRTLLDSRATDLMAGLGPQPLHAGASIGVREEASGPIPASTIAPWSAPHDDELVVELAAGRSRRLVHQGRPHPALRGNVDGVERRRSSRRATGRAGARACPRRASCPAKAWSPEPFRYRPRAGRRSSSRTGRSPADTP